VVGSEVQYARSSDGVDIAYQVIGDGPVDLVFVSGFITHLDWSWELPHFAWLEQLDGIARVITFDKRGTGLSDRSLGFGSVEERSRDIAAVMDAVGSQRTTLCGVSEGGPMSILFAATNPDRVAGLVLIGSFACGSQAADSAMGSGAPDRLDALVASIEAEWGTGKVFSRFVQHASDPDAATRLIARFERNACTPQMAAQIMRHNSGIDVRPVLATVSAPTTVIHATGDPAVPFENGRYLAEHIDGARFVVVDGDFHGSWRAADVAVWRDEVVDALGDAGAPARAVDRVLSTVLFTDIVASTTRAAELGDALWHNLMDRHDRVVASEVRRFGGRIVKNTGDGVLATFDGPSRGIGCAHALIEALRAHDLDIRGGLHTGEIELRGDDVTGLGVVIASRICDLAERGQVLVTRTVKDLVAGSDIALVDAGEHRLAGIPEPWQLYELVR
jgi:class 3 adenylate cyclase